MGKIINLSVLVSMVDKDLDKEANISDKLPDHLKTVLKERIDQRAKERAAAAADTIINLIEESEDRKRRLVLQIRDSRRQIAAAQSQLADIDAAIAYGNESSNYLPLAAMVGSNIPMQLAQASLDPTLCQIPATPKKTSRSK